ncbi:MAG: hypothetical protein J0H39_00670 [Alphaproteobacteria bacterium]|nr:hypothetical protein [Alphaproteobacteria bacterium]
MDRGKERLGMEIPRLLAQGLDSLYVSFWLDVACGDLDFDDLAFRKEQLRQSRNVGFAEVRLGREHFALKPFGRHPYPFVLANDAFELRLGEHLRPACYVQFASKGLWLSGLEGTISRFREWAASCRLLETRPEQVSRADWAFDYHLPVADFTAGNFVTRATKSAVWAEHGANQSFQIGKGDTVIRVYDKIAEIEQQSAKAWLFEIWGRQTEVWRVEFQVRRERLALGGIGTLASLHDEGGDLLRELATKHTSLRQPSTDANRSRWPLHPLWLAVLRDIDRLPQTGLIRAIDPGGSIEWRLFQQAKSLYGSLKGLGALLSIRGGKPAPKSLAGILGDLPGILARHHSEPEWHADLERRMTGYRLGQW